MKGHTRTSTAPSAQRGSFYSTARGITFPLGAFLLFLAMTVASFQGQESTVTRVLLSLGVILMVAAAISNWAWFTSRLFSRATGYGLNNLILILAVVAIAGLCNYVMQRHNTRVDMTADRRFSLSDQTLKVLERLDDPVECQAYFLEGGQEDQRKQRASVENTLMRRLLERYAEASSKFTFRMIDPEKDPIATKAAGVKYNATVILKTKDKEVTIDPDKMFEYNRSLFAQRLQQFRGEQALTSALLDLTTGAVRTVYFLEGHGERSLDDDGDRGYSTMKEYLLRDHYRYESLNLYLKPEIPENCTVLVVAGPVQPFQETELAAIEKYLDAGRSALFLLDLDAPQGLRELLAKYGITSKRSILIDPSRCVQSLFRERFVTQIVPEYGDHEITADLKENKRFAMLPNSTLIEKKASEKGTYTYYPLLSTSGESWAETQLDQPRASLDPSVDTKGPVQVAYAFDKPGEKTGGEEEDKGEDAHTPDTVSRCVVFGNVDFAANRNLGQPANIDLFMNSINWLSGETDKISIRPKSEEIPRLDPTVTEAASRIFTGTMVLLPGFFFALGGFVWWRRSRL